ncbi:hypothetical protein Vadar_005902 [Vaccinium darrowii]|uniref:Uncharacterized protein n=1 Tax=Vaccinium darrowii TaxID=229202 RepID=A0ACB7XNJ0_9ERIC|nr:hypothetical protein Vadar_005902 [Vaccinium darrowii]
MAKKGANRKSRSGPPLPRKRATIAAVTSRSTTIPELPDDVTCKILLRISDIKSLARCKQVCKNWRNLILQPYFAKSHLLRGSLPLSLILYLPSDGPTNPAHFGILELDDNLARLSRPNATVKFISAIYIPRKECHGGRVIGACNGLVCLRVDNDVVVCNPILPGRHFVLPKLPKLAKAFSSVRFGFGFCPLSVEYKVLTCTVTRKNHLYNMTFDIFTLGRDDTWRSIGGHNRKSFPRFYTGDDFVFVNGALHWLGTSMASKFLCYFDVENEELGSLTLDCHIGGVSHLGVLDGLLYLSDLRSLSDVKVWVMEDYIQTGAWTLKWVVELQHLHVVDGPVRPIKILKDGTVLMIFRDKRLISYNPQTRVIERINYRRVGFWTASIAHTPNFFCPPWLL